MSVVCLCVNDVLFMCVELYGRGCIGGGWGCLGGDMHGDNDKK